MKRSPSDIIRDVFQAENDDVDEDLDLRELPGWDSLNHMNFIAALESEYQIMLTGDEIAEMLSLGVIRRILQENYGLAI